MNRIIAFLFFVLTSISALAGENMDTSKLKSATFGGGCFWCMQPPYDNLDGVKLTTVGYAQGITPDPTYEQISTGTTGHVEVIQILFDPAKISYDEIVSTYWKNIDPFDPDGQFADQGEQYRPVILYADDEQKKIAENSKLDMEKKFGKKTGVKVEKLKIFYPAEQYHQKYYEKNAIRYEYYKIGSGRAGKLKELWGE
jgi:peptide-methionine (S)-S-oxide reductase